MSLFLAPVFVLFTAVGPGESRVTPLAGGKGDFARATHVRLEGSWFEIGRELARLGKERHDCAPRETDEPERVRAQRDFFARAYPAQLERMRGSADFFGVDAEDDGLDLDSLAYATPRAACTVVFYPPGTTEDGRGVLARNFDFTTGTFDGRAPAVGEPIACAEPYVLELHPSEGHASLALVSFDLLGVVDGINSQGLTVALLADDELSATGRARPTPGPRAGLDVLQVGRFLLDTCADVEEAEHALRSVPLYYASIPCHYLIADRHGRAFVWENAVDLGEGHSLHLEETPLVSTNYLQHLHPAGPPPDRDPLGLYGRERTLCKRFEGQGAFSLDEIRANAEAVSPRGSNGPGRALTRTLWQGFYFPAERRLEVCFYLGEGGAGGAPRRSEVSAFVLDGFALDVARTR